MSVIFTIELICLPSAKSPQHPHYPHRSISSVLCITNNRRHAVSCLLSCKVSICSYIMSLCAIAKRQLLRNCLPQSCNQHSLPVSQLPTWIKAIQLYLESYVLFVLYALSLKKGSCAAACAGRYFNFRNSSNCLLYIVSISLLYPVTICGRISL